MTFDAVDPLAFVDETVTLPDGRPWLAVRRLAGAPGRRRDDGGARRVFVLVHGLSSNARLWDGVSRALHAAGHDSLAVDLRGHGRSEAPEGGYDTDTVADDLAALLRTVGLTGDRAPIVVGQSWGGNVVLSLAARHPGSVAGAVCVDGGWIRLRDSFDSFAACWAALAPPLFDRMTYRALAGLVRGSHPDWPAEGIEGTLANLVELPDGGVRARLARAHHESIVRSLYEGDPSTWYPRIDVPVMLVPATGPEASPGDDGGEGRKDRTRTAVRAALAALPRGDVRWYPGADHDLHAQFPERLAADLVQLNDVVGTAPAEERQESIR